MVLVSERSIQRTELGEVEFKVVRSKFKNMIKGKHLDTILKLKTCKTNNLNGSTSQRIHKARINRGGDQKRRKEELKYASKCQLSFDRYNKTIFWEILNKVINKRREASSDICHHDTGV